MCHSTNPPARAGSDAGPDEDQLAVHPAAAPAGLFVEPPVEPEPVKLVYTDGEAGSRYDPDSPRRYQIRVPIRLPFAHRPDAVAPPPYYPPPGTHCDGLMAHRDAHLAILRPVLAGAFAALLGPDAPVHQMVDTALLEEYHEGSIINDRDVNFDLERGWWKDQYGREGNRIDAYWDTGNTLYVVTFFEFRLSWSVGADDIDPPILRLVARDESDEDGEVVFDVSEVAEGWRLCYNSTIRERGTWR